MLTPPDLSIRTRMIERGPCPTHTTSTNSSPSVHKIGEMTSRNRSATRCGPLPGMLNPFPFDMCPNKKVGMSPLTEGAPYHALLCKARGLAGQQCPACSQHFCERTRLSGADGLPIDLDDSEHFERRSGQKYLIRAVKKVDR